MFYIFFFLNKYLERSENWAVLHESSDTFNPNLPYNMDHNNISRQTSLVL